MEYLHKNREQFREAVARTAADTGFVAEAVEKDYYVSMILREMSETLPFAVFKGGTSLSKCYRVIKRFSEDIDLTADIPLSQGQKKKMKYSLIDVVHKLGLNVINLDETRSRRDYNRYEIAYDSVFSSYYNSISSVIMLETSFTACSFPTVIMSVESMVGDMLKAEAPELLEKYELNAFCMKVQGLDRTLADKVFAVCDYYLQNRVRKHSRHLYDSTCCCLW